MTSRQHHISTGVHGTVFAYRITAAGWTAVVGAAGRISTNPFQGGLQSSSSSVAHGGKGIDAEPTADAPAVQRGGLRGWRAVKVVVAGPEGWSEGRRPHNVRTEAAVLRRVDHPNVVKVLQHDYIAGTWEHRLEMPLLAFPLSFLLQTPAPRSSATVSCTSGHLPDPSHASHPSQRISDTDDSLGPLAHPAHPAHLAHLVAADLLSGLSYLHREGVAHRDVKPDNLVFGWDGVLRLVDFGTAWCGRSSEQSERRSGGSERRSGGSEERGRGHGLWERTEGTDSEDMEMERRMVCEVGTGPYRAPELLFSPRTYDPFALDLWSAGCVLAELFIRPARASTGAPLNLDTASSLDSSDEESPRVSPPDASTRMGRSGGVGPHSHDIDDIDVYGDGEEGGDDDDGLEDTRDTPPECRATLFDASFGDLGLAASIFRIRGSPTSDRWKTFTLLPDADKILFDHFEPRSLRDLLSDIVVLGDQGVPALEVLEGLLQLDPGLRIPAQAALESSWLREMPSSMADRDECERASVILGRESRTDRGAETRMRLLEPWLGPARRKWDEVE